MSDICAHIAKPEAFTLTLSGDRGSLGIFIAMLERVAEGCVEPTLAEKLVAREVFDQVSFFRGK